MNSTWDPYLNEAISDWSASLVLNLTRVTGSARPKNCRPTTGRIEACNANYGNNGWLGIAQIWASGSHITQAITKVNDTYFNTATYNTPAWRRLVMCQEIAHDFGLDHQDENFSNPNLGSCMDYTNDPDGGGFYGPSNEHPNSHDFQQLAIIYSAHTDTSTTLSQTSGGSANGRSGTASEEGPNNPADFGRPVGPRDGEGRYILFERDERGGGRLLTHVFWVPGHPGRR